MTLIIETEVPDWVRWVAQDEDGDWWAYEDEPKIPGRGSRRWLNNLNGRCIPIGSGDGSNPNWRETLHEVVVK
jgi:hypothetical protein